MSFSQEQKKFIISQPIRSACCRGAYFHGILAGKGACEGNTVSVTCDSLSLAEYIRALVKEIYGKDGEIANGKSGGRIKLVSFDSPSAARYVSAFLEGEEGLKPKCNGCLSHYLRGLFLVSGRISDPSKQYSLEFSARGRTHRICELLTELGLSPKIAVKRSEELVYFRKSSDIEDFLALSSLNSAAFELMNVKIQGEIRNNANRIANCETNNIEKAVASSVKQLALLRELESKGLVSQLPEELEHTARMRMEHDDLSLSQLAATFTPKISKSGLSHRLKAINELALSLLGYK